MRCTILAFLILAGTAYCDESKLSLQELPQPVLAAVKARFPDAAPTGASKETEEGKLVYEVTVRQKGQTIDVTLVPEGEILMIEKEITARGLPQPVAKALRDKYPKASYKIVEEINKVENKQEKLAYYEVLLVTGDKKALEVQVLADGKIVNEEPKDQQEEEK